MDPITVLSIAGNIVQLVDFAIKVVSKGYKIHRSADGSTVENHDLETVANDLVIIQMKLRQSLHPYDAKPPLSDEDQALADLTATSIEVAAALLEKLNMIKAQGRFRRWNSLRQALKSVTSKSDVDDLARRFAMLRDQVNTRILVGLRAKIDVISVQQSKHYQLLDQASKDILQALEENQAVLAKDVTRLSTTIMQSITEKQDISEKLVRETGHSIIASIEKLERTWRRRQRQKDQGWAARLETDAPATIELVENAILSSFLFPTMEQRQEGIAEAHTRTFQWIFQDSQLHKKPWDNFPQWLESQSGIYWIGGKAASGKSTLMKFVCEHDMARSRLNAWAKPHQLVCGNFFFWNTGTSLQKSQTGLLRSLIHQILNQYRKLIPDTLPALWKKVSNQNATFLSQLYQSWHPWSLQELRQVIETLFKQTASSIKFCFFIDGLDEFDGEHREIASLMTHLSQLPHIKLCLSSRPLMVFEQEFDDCPKLSLQDLTVDDIRFYVQDKLNEHKRMSALQQREPVLTQQLVSEIVHKSSGVFLWVSLVTKSLLKGLTNMDNVSDLQRALQELPPELDDLFSVMLGSIKPHFYLEQASRLFQVVYHSRSSLSTIELSFADDEDVDLATRSVTRTLSPSEESNRDIAMRARVKSRCAGLLEVRSDQRTRRFGNRVYYLHLTVKEFLEKPEIWSTVLRCTAGTSFNAHVSLLRANILLLKSSFDLANIWDSGTSDLVINAMHYAAYAENSTGKPQVALLDALCETVHHMQRIGSVTSEGPMHMLFDTRKCEGCNCSRRCNLFVECAITCGLVLYVKSILGNEIHHVNQRSISTLLHQATAPDVQHTVLKSSFRLQPAMVDMLLQAGLDPNERRNGTTPWSSFLQRLSERCSSAIDLPWLDTCKLYLHYGANPKAIYKRVPAVEIVHKAFLHLPPEPLEELEALFLRPSNIGPPSPYVSRKRKVSKRGWDLPPTKKWISGSQPRACMPISRSSLRGHNAWRTETGPSQEPYCPHVVDWSYREPRLTRQTPNHDTYGRREGNYPRWREPGPKRGTRWNGRNICDKWHDWYEDAPKFEDLTDHQRAQRSGSKRYEAHYGTFDRRLGLDRNNTVSRSYGDQLNRRRDFEHQGRADSGYDEYPSRSYGYESTPVSYREFAPYPPYTAHLSSWFEDSVRRHAEPD